MFHETLQFMKQIALNLLNDVRIFNAGELSYAIYPSVGWKGNNYLEHDCEEEAKYSFTRGLQCSTFIHQGTVSPAIIVVEEKYNGWGEDFCENNEAHMYYIRNVI